MHRSRNVPKMCNITTSLECILDICVICGAMWNTDKNTDKPCYFTCNLFNRPHPIESIEEKITNISRGISAHLAYSPKPFGLSTVSINTVCFGRYTLPNRERYSKMYLGMTLLPSSRWVIGAENQYSGRGSVTSQKITENIFVINMHESMLKEFPQTPIVRHDMPSENRVKKVRDYCCSRGTKQCPLFNFAGTPRYSTFRQGAADGGACHSIPRTLIERRSCFCGAATFRTPLKMMAVLTCAFPHHHNTARTPWVPADL